MVISFFLKTQDHLTERPAHVITRRWMNLALTTGFVRRIGQNAIKAVTEHTLKEIKDFARTGIRPVIKSNYIPSKLPPREVPGCYFQPPQSDTWKLQHRTVSFMQ